MLFSIRNKQQSCSLLQHRIDASDCVGYFIWMVSFNDGMRTMLGFYVVYRILTTRLCCTSMPKTDARLSKRRSNSWNKSTNRSVGPLRVCPTYNDHMTGGWWWQRGHADEWINRKWEWAGKTGMWISSWRLLSRGKASFAIIQRGEVHPKLSWYLRIFPNPKGVNCLGIIGFWTNERWWWKRSLWHF